MRGADHAAMPKRTLTNDYRDCSLIRLDPAERHSPFIVSQEGCAPDDMQARTRMFYLQRDGVWIDEVARSKRPDSEIGDIVFESPTEAVQLLSRLFGKAKVRDLPITDADVEAYIETVKSFSSAEEAYRLLLARHRAASRKR